MRQLLMTGAVIVPFLSVGALAQETPPPADAGTEVEAQEAEDAEAQEADVQVIEAEPAEGEAVAPAEPVGGETAEEAQPVPEAIVREQAENELRVRWITGTTITSPDGETIGSVEDLILDGDTGQLNAAIVGVGGFLGIGEKQIAVDWAELQIDYDAQEITMDLTREEAEGAPDYAFRAQEPAPAPEGTVDPMATGTGTTADPMGTGGTVAPGGPVGTTGGTIGTDPAAPTADPAAPTADPAAPTAEPAPETEPAN